MIWLEAVPVADKDNKMMTRVTDGLKLLPCGRFGGCQSLSLLCVSAEMWKRNAALKQPFRLEEVSDPEVPACDRSMSLFEVSISTYMSLTDTFIYLFILKKGDSLIISKDAFSNNTNYLGE